MQNFFVNPCIPCPVAQHSKGWLWRTLRSRGGWPPQTSYKEVTTKHSTFDSQGPGPRTLTSQLLTPSKTLCTLMAHPFMPDSFLANGGIQGQQSATPGQWHPLMVDITQQAMKRLETCFSSKSCAIAHVIFLFCRKYSSFLRPSFRFSRTSFSSTWPAEPATGDQSFGSQLLLLP